MKQLTLEQKVQKALDFQEISNVMARHCYFHGGGMLHREEVNQIWAKKTKGITWTANSGTWVDENFKKMYVEDSDISKQKELERMIKVHPEIENKKENWGVGNLIFHPITTPLIEVAGDGKTAKGLWYSTGQITMIGDDMKPHARWMWAKYGVDFVKEDGVWKIWHLHRYYDFSTPVGKSWVDEASSPAVRGHIGFTDDVRKPDRPASYLYNEYSPTTVPQYLPKPPEPYETFDLKDAY